MEFAIDKLALLIAAASSLLFFILWRWKQQFLAPQLFFSDLATLRSFGSNWRTHLVTVPRWLVWAALGLFVLAFIDPHLLIPKTTPPEQKPTEGIAIYIVADQSGSMTEKVHVTGPQGTVEDIRKIDLLKQITTEFIEGSQKLGLPGRPNDLIGLIAFARTAHILSPLTLDHKAIVQQLNNINVVTSKDQDGTAIGYALYKTVNLIAATRHYANDLAGGDRPAYDIKSAIIILVTDGFDNPSILDKDNPLRNISPITAAQYAKEKGVKIYLVNIDPILGSQQYAPQRHQMQKTAEITGGKYFLINDVTSLAQIYAAIDQLQKSALPTEAVDKEKQPQNYQRISFYPYLIALGLILLLVGTILRTTILRQTP